MNTDNTAISGETIDFGPCAMMGVYNPNTVFSSIDRQGRYAFGNQPTIAQWNMARFAETLLPLIDEDETKAIETASALVTAFTDLFAKQYGTMMARKTGIQEIQASDQQLISALLEQLEKKKLDYTVTFSDLTGSLSSPTLEAKMRDQLSNWYDDWRQRLAHDGRDSSEIQQQMRQANPLVIPRNHHMENVIQTCIESGEPAAAEEFLTALRSPYAMTHKTLQFQDACDDMQLGYQTFCV